MLGDIPIDETKFDSIISKNKQFIEICEEVCKEYPDIEVNSKDRKSVV